LSRNAGKTHEKALLLCKVICGTSYKTKKNMSTITQPPSGFHSVLGEAGGLRSSFFVLLSFDRAEDLNYDEIVTYSEDSILPFAIVHYQYKAV
jgi:hypothetical protein